MGVPDPEKPAVDHKCQCICAVYLSHGGPYGEDDVAVLTEVLVEDVDYKFRIRIGLEDGSRLEVFLLDLVVGGQVAVVGDGHHTGTGYHGHRLGVLDALTSGSGIPYMTDSDLALVGLQALLRKSRLDKPGTFDGVDLHPVENRDAGAVLSAVLNDHQGLLQRWNYVMVGIDADYTAVVPKTRHCFTFLDLLAKFSPGIGPYPCGLAVSAGSANSLPDVVRALSAPAAGNVRLELVVPSLCCCSCSHFNFSLW